MHPPIYLDNNATTPADPSVVEAMLPYFTQAFGNASQQHRYGAEAAAAVDRARAQVASLIGARPREIVFTSGATESNNLAIVGVAHRSREEGTHLVTVLTEHASVLAPCRQLEREGFTVTYLPVGGYGQIDPGSVAEAVTDRTVLVSVMAANNEIGTLHPIREIGEICRERGVLFHTDAVQALGKIPLDVEDLSVDLLSLSAHKVYGPKGVGALFVRSRQPEVRLQPLLFGGGQERGLRSGTLAVPNIVGFGRACTLCAEILDREPRRLLALQDRLFARLAERLDGLSLNGHPSARLPGLLNVRFPAVDGDALLFALKDVAVSQGSACAAGSFEPSHVLRALGVSDEQAKASLRFGIGRFTTEDEIDRAAESVAAAVTRLRQMHTPACQETCDA
jgi:cysteine desulfurase